MSVGDIIYHDQYLVDVRLGLHDEDADVFKLAIVDNTITPTATLADPRFGAGGTTNMSANEVTPGGNYPAGGLTIANNTLTLVGGASIFDGDDLAMAQDPSNPANVYWGLIVNTTSANRIVGFVELGTALDLTTGPFALNWNVSGISSMDQA